jgi:hypothetical protein
MYRINYFNLEKVDTFTDLGVIVTKNLLWDKHIQTCITRANKRMGFVKRNIGYNCSILTKLRCYITLVRPLLEYGTTVWSVINKQNLCKIENIQRATKFILGDYNSSYKERLLECKLLPLSLRRQFLDIIFVYNSLHNLNDYNILAKLDFFDPAANRNTRYNVNQDELMFKFAVANHDNYRRFFTHRIIKTWNKIPYEIRAIELTESGRNTSFKREIKEWLYQYVIESFNDNTCTWIIDCACNKCRIT